MDKVISEVVIGALVISLMFFVIPLYRNNSELIKNMAGKADYSEKIKEVMLPGISDDSICYGSDVISVIRYYALKGGGKIRFFDNVNGSCVYSGDAYDSTVYEIDPNKVFYINIIEVEGEPLQIEFSSN